MTVTTTPQQVKSTHDEWSDRRWRLTGLVFAALWLVTAVLFVQLGEKRSDLNQLSASISEGSVTQVEVVGAPQERWRGRTQVTLKWQGSVLSRFAQVTVDSDRKRNWTVEGDHIVGDPVKNLQAIAYPRDLDITYSDHSSYQEWHGWRAPDVPYAAALAAWFGTILLAGAGPQPWRATSWAWIWLILLSGPFGSAAYLLLGGPLGVARPRHPSRRLTGGWAFLLSLAVFGGSNAA